ncbi:MAG: hypothetical protein HYZ74_03860 [Elusimicrobia bacterium]|nr:hypothetical protein [Elusimicrobiota bacterium]
MRQTIALSMLAAALSVQSAWAQPAKAKELRAAVRQDREALRKEWLDRRRELAALKVREAEERKGVQVSGASAEAKKGLLAALVKNYVEARGAVRGKHKPARAAMKEKLRADMGRLKAAIESR